MRLTPYLTSRFVRVLGAVIFASTIFLNQHLSQPVSAQAVLTVRTVPWLGLPNKSHEVFSGGSIVLQGVATMGLTDTPGTGIASAVWDPGDGSPAVSVSFANPLAIERIHTYTGAPGTPFTATLTVTPTTGPAVSDTFKVVIRAKTIDVEANMAIDKGLWYLHKSMNRALNAGVPVGWLSGNDVPSTAGSAQAFQINNHRTTGNVAEDPYVHDTSRMLRYLESQLTTQALSVQTAGYAGRSDNPDSNGNNIGIVYTANGQPNYTNGQIMDAFVASGTPTQMTVLGPAGVVGRAYQDIIRDMNDYNAWSQMDINASQRGSWFYSPSNNTSAGHGDNSIAQWPAIGGIAAERTWSISIQPFVKSEALQYLPTTYNTAAAGNYSGVSRLGSFGYANIHAGWSENFATTPSALIQYIWAGVGHDPTPDGTDTPDEIRVREGYRYMARYHRIRNIYSCCDATHGGINFYALYATAKAYRLNIDETGAFAPITLVDDDPADGVPAWDWYYNDPAAGAPASAGPRGMARAVIGNQNAAGQFPGAGSWTGNMSTAWGIIILSPTLFNLGPTAVCTANPQQIGSFGGNVNFSAAGSSHNDPDGVIVSYTFTFDDAGSSQTGASNTASHVYPSRTTFPHTYNATVTVTDSNGLTDTAQCPVEQVNTNVAPDADSGGPYFFCQGSPMLLDGTGSNDAEDGTVASYKWDWTAPFNFTPPDATTATVDVSAFYNAVVPGVYDVGLQVTDSLPATNTEFTTVTVRAATDPLCNQPPVATDNSYTIAEDTVLNGNAVTDAPADSDPDADALTASLVSGVSNGSLVFNADGSFTYTPNANTCVADSFTYKVNDGTVDSNVATVSIAVTCVNDAPTAEDDTNATSEDTPVSGSVTANDTAVDIEGDTLTWSKTSDPANGSVSFTNGSYTYTPNADFCGTDSFTYAISDGTASDPATVTITVTCVNDPPVANDNAHTTPEDTPVSGTATSTDVDGGAPTYALGTGPTNGTLVFNASGAYTYSPNPNYNGPDSFTFSVSDGNGGSDTGQVTINVTPVNDAPVCTAAAPSVSFIWPPNHQLVNVTVNGVTDPVEGSAITITVDSIWQDEPTDTIGDGNTPIDGYGVGTSTAQVRAERSGSKRVPGNGRMYHIFFTGTDAQGGTCTGTVQVAVPHDMGEEHTVGDGGPLYKSTGS